LDKKEFKDDPFLKGMFADMVGEGRDEKERWIPQFTDGSVDGIVLVCGTEHEVKAKTAELKQKYFCQSHGITPLLTLEGNERPGDQKGHEQ